MKKYRFSLVFDEESVQKREMFSPEKNCHPTYVALISTPEGIVNIPERILLAHVSELRSVGGLADTSHLMVSDDYKNRFRAEYLQLKYRTEHLKIMLDKWDNGKLSFTPTCPRSIYDIQLRSMTDYLAILETRAIAENIEL